MLLVILTNYIRTMTTEIPIISSNQRTVYKSAGNYIVTLKLDSSCKTNENRKNIIDPMYAKYKCDKAYVDDIRHKNTNKQIDCIKSDYDRNFSYIRGEISTVENYDNSKVCSNGIHYYLSYGAAFCYKFNDKICSCNDANITICLSSDKHESWHDANIVMLPCSPHPPRVIKINAIYNCDNNYLNQKDGPRKLWHDNGQLYKKCNYVNGKINGLYESWYENRQQYIMCDVVDGKLNGSYESWYKNGQMYVKCDNVDGEKNGTFNLWHQNGQMHIDCDYVNGKENGIYKSWYYTGQIDEKCEYVDGTLEGVYEAWHANGQIYIKCNYVNGEKEGLYELWNDDGQIIKKLNYVNGDFNGICESWHSNGQLKEKYNCANNKRDGCMNHGIQMV